MVNPNELKLVYVLKIGYNSKGEGLYEFIFAKNIERFYEEEVLSDLMWDELPATNAEAPDEDLIDKVYSLKTSKYNFYCLHEADDRAYSDGVDTIHCLAHECEKEVDEYENMFDNINISDEPIMVFHFGMSIDTVKDIFYARDIILEKNSFIHTVNMNEE